MVKVALDALGGDFAPDVVIEGAINAANKDADLHIVLCGPEAEVKAGLEKRGYTGHGISVVDAPDPVAMDEHPVQVLKKKPFRSGDLRRPPEEGYGRCFRQCR